MVPAPRPPLTFPKLMDSLPTRRQLEHALPALRPYLEGVRKHYGGSKSLQPGPYQQQLEVFKELCYKDSSIRRQQIGLAAPITDEGWRGIDGRLTRWFSFLALLGHPWNEISMSSYIHYTTEFFYYLTFLMVGWD